MKTSSKTWHRLQRKIVGESPGSLVKGRRGKKNYENALILHWKGDGKVFKRVSVLI